jgi:hypothetical protein
MAPLAVFPLIPAAKTILQVTVAPGELRPVQLLLAEDTLLPATNAVADTPAGSLSWKATEVPLKPPATFPIPKVYLSVDCVSATEAAVFEIEKLETAPSRMFRSSTTPLAALPP